MLNILSLRIAVGPCCSGYNARFRHLPNGDITIARIKHQKEDDFK